MIRKRHGLPLISLVGLGLGLAAPANAATRTYALVIAANRSLDPKVPALRFADDDGVRNYELFSLFADHAALFTVLDDDTARIHPEASRRAEVPERAAILRRLGEWNHLMEADLARGDEPELYFVYAGHGDVDPAGMGYVSLHDAKLTRADLFHDVVAPSKASFIHLVVDACKSYFLVNARGGTWKDDRAPESHDGALSQFLGGESQGRYPRVGVIVATSGDQETHEWSRWRGGILSHELRSALLGAGDVNGDGRVEYSEVRAFIAAANARVKNPEARLAIHARAPQVDRHRALVDLRRSAAREARFLHFAQGDHGLYSLEDDRGLRYLDMNKEAASEFDIALDPRRTYHLRHEEQEEAEIRPLAIKPRKIRVDGLRFHSRAMASRGALEETFRRDLYQVPYGRGFYDGYVATSGDLAVEGGSSPFLVAEPRRRLEHALSAGYLVSGAPLSVPGQVHAADVRYQYRAFSWLDVGLSFQVGRGSVSDQAVTRVAVLGTVAGEYRPVAALALRLEVAGGYQYAVGTIRLENAGLVGGDAGGARVEAGGGIGYDFAPSFGLYARGGLAIDVATLKIPSLNYTDTASNLSPFLSLSAIVRL
ncbi:MAG: hypothetical protein EXR72_11700 [Myxococcales bacterium]|nr:hypothetical protein [Myxococcales bacterium]